MEEEQQASGYGLHLQPKLNRPPTLTDPLKTYNKNTHKSFTYSRIDHFLAKIKEAEGKSRVPQYIVDDVIEVLAKEKLQPTHSTIRRILKNNISGGRKYYAHITSLLAKITGAEKPLITEDEKAYILNRFDEYISLSKGRTSFVSYRDLVNIYLQEYRESRDEDNKDFSEWLESLPDEQLPGNHQQFNNSKQHDKQQDKPSTDNQNVAGADGISVPEKGDADDNADDNADDDDCPICLCKIVKDEHKTQCNHSFHNICINVWKKKEKTCPLCRSDI